jgi:hypothetical protein
MLEDSLLSGAIFTLVEAQTWLVFIREFEICSSGLGMIVVYSCLIHLADN